MRCVGRSVLAIFALAWLLLVAFPGNAQVTGLRFRPVDAAYSLVMDRVILISANPDRLHIYDPVAQTDQTVALPGTPLNLSLSPDGTHAAVAFTNAVVYVDLHTASVSNTFSNVAVGTARVICGSGYIYIFGGSGGKIISIDIAAGQASTASAYTYAQAGTFDPAINAIYGTQASSPDSLSRFDTSAGTVGSATSQPSEYFDAFHVCGPLWISHDGSIIYSACGAVYRASSNSTEDMRYLGTLPITNVAVNSAESLTTSDTLNQVAVIPAVQPYIQPVDPFADTIVNLYASSSFNPIGRFATTPFQVNGTSFAAHGRWVFYNSSSSAMFVITQADSSAGLVQDYALENINLTNPNSCNASFGTASTDAIAAGSYQAVQIVSGEDCVFTATSNASWVALSSGYYGSGNTTLKFLIRPNLSGSPRSGTISVGSETFAVHQDAAGAAASLVPLSMRPVAAAYDDALDKIVMVSASPNELHVYDPITQADQIVPLGYAPLSVSVRPDGLFAAVGHSGKVSIVDLQGATVSKALSVDMDAGGIVLASNNYVYLFPGEPFGGKQVQSVEISSGTVTSVSIPSPTYGSFPRLDASGKYIYLGSTSFGVSKLDISAGTATVTTGSSETYGGNIWLSQDGSRLINSRGQVLFTSPVPEQDLQPDGQLSGTSHLDWAADSQIQQEIAVLTDPASTLQDTQLQIYASNGLLLEHQSVMPGFSNGDTSYASHGKYVFWNAAASKLFAITEADNSSGLLSDFAVYTINAPQSLPGCTYSVSPPSLNVPASYSYNLVVTVASNCNWAVSTPSANWLGASSNSGVVTGNGQFNVYVQANTGGARSGTVTVGNQIVTIHQAAVTCSYALSQTSASFSATGGTGQINLTTGAGCPWSVQSNSSWLTVAGNQSGSGSASIQFSVTPASGSPVYRYGSLNIAGVMFNVTQTNTAVTGAAGVNISPSALNFAVKDVLTPPGQAQAVRLNNPTTQTVRIGQISITGANAASFSATSTCGESIGPAATCFVEVYFTPLLVGDNIATLNITALDGTKTGIGLSGVGQLIGAVEIMSMPTGKVLEVPDASSSNGTLIAQNALNGSEQQQWRLVPTGDGYYVIQNALTGKVLDVVGRDTNNGALVQQYDYLEGRNQQWRLLSIDGVHYAIINRQSGLVLDVRDGLTSNGALVQQWAYLGDPQQLWVIEPIRSYNIVNTLSSQMLDVTGGSAWNGATLQQWTADGGRQQQWQLVPIDGTYFAIMNRNSGKVLDVTGGSDADGALIQQWDYLGGANQQWQIVTLDGGNYKIVNRQSGYVLDDTGFSKAAGTSIQQWSDTGATNQQWQITPVIYYAVSNKKSLQVLDVIDGSMENGARVQQWYSNGLQQQQWQMVLVAEGAYLLVNNKSGKVLDVSNFSAANGAPLQQWDHLNGANQEWQIVPTGNGYCVLKNINSQKVLDVTGASVETGALLQQWDDLNGLNQQWEFFQVN